MDEIELLRRVGSGLPERDDVSRTHAWARLQMRMATGAIGGGYGGHAVRKGRWLTALASVAVALLSLIVLLGGLPGGARVSPASAATLNSLAGVAGDQPHREVEPGQYVYTRSEGSETISGLDVSSSRQWSVVVPVLREAWIGLDGSGRIVETYGEPRFSSPQDEQAWEAAGAPDLFPEGKTSDVTYPAGELTFLNLSGLPTDPESLRRVIENREVLRGPPGDWETFDIVGDLLRETSGPPAVRAALFQVAAQLPGVEFLGQVRDGAGRWGVAVGYTHLGVRNELIFDRRTSSMLGERSHRIDGDGAGLGAVLSWTVYLTSGVVDSLYL